MVRRDAPADRAAPARRASCAAALAPAGQQAPGRSPRRAAPPASRAPETPSTSVATAASLMLASSSTFWRRLATARALLDQVRAVARQVAQFALRGDGMKLPQISPWRSRSAIHSASFTSVFRPGTALMCCGIRHQQRQLPFKQVVHRPPVATGALHGDMGTAQAGQPVEQGE